MRLRDLWADPPNLLTHREVINLISYLPNDAHTVLLVRGEDAPWSREMHRLTDIAERLDWANWQRGGGGKSKEPKPFRRPQAAAERDERDRDEQS